MALLADLNAQGSTIVMVTHEDGIAAYSQRIIHFLDGRIRSDKLNGLMKDAPVVKEDVYGPG